MNKMSEDEAIKRLQEILDFKKNTIDKIEDPIQREIEENCYIEEMPFKAIETILDLYQKEKEKNKELENADLTIVYMNGFYEGENKWKDKIRAKIKELENELKYENFRDGNLIQINVLKKILEEE